MNKGIKYFGIDISHLMLQILMVIIISLKTLNLALRSSQNS